MPTIQELIPDIYKTIGIKDGNIFTEDNTHELASTLHRHFGQPKERRGLRLSGMGPKCPRALWYSIHHPELAESLPPYAEIKYAYGHIIEALVLSLARAAGHEVTGEQDELVVSGITGHRDAVIDGCIVDVKSSSTLGFQKFKAGLLWQDDSFGYLDQLDGYLLGSADDDLVRTKDRGYILAIDKQLGHMCLYEHKLRADHIRTRIETYKRIVGRDSPPECTCGTVAEGSAGNRRLDTKASYNPFKYQCFPQLRTCLYAGKAPVYFTEVKKWPRNSNGPLPEVDKHGKQVYTVS